MLLLPWTVLDTTIAHLHYQLPDEGCGLVEGTRDAADDVGTGVRYIPCRNAAREPRATFVLNRDDYAAASAACHRDGLVMLAVVHSHPTAPAVPSRADRGQVCVLDALIVSLAGPEPVARLWRWDRYDAWERVLEIYEDL